MADGTVVEIEVYGAADEALDSVRQIEGVTGVVVENRDQAQVIVVQTARGPELTQAIMARLQGVEPRTRDDARADPRGCVRRAGDAARPGRTLMKRLLRTMTLGWALHFKQESRNPFFLWIVICTPVIYATMTYFLFQGGEQPSTLVAAAVGSALMGIWSLTTTAAAAALQRQRRLGILELLVASPTPFWATFLPITIAIGTIGIYSLGTGILYVRLLFGVPVSVENWPAFIAAVPPTIFSIGMLGFLMGSAFVRFRAAWMVGNLFEFPVWTICGFLIPLALLPGWVEPIAWALRSDVGNERPAECGPREPGVAGHRDVHGALGRLCASRRRCS